MSSETENRTHEYKGVEYPLYPFDVPAVVKLPNGANHHFRQWDEVTEKNRENSQKTIVLTSPAVIHGENPRDAKTDYTKSLLKYYSMMIEGVSGVKGVEGFTPDQVIPAKHIIEGSFRPDGKPTTVLDLIGAPIKRAAAARLYGGKIEIERADEAEDSDIETDAGDPFADELSITDEVDKAENRAEIYQLTLNRSIVVRQELGIEQLRNGSITPPSHVIRYTFREADGDEFSMWELKAHRGFAVSRPKGGQRVEQFYNLDTINSLFDKLIERIDGASLGGMPIELPPIRDDKHRQAILTQVPLAIKKATVTQLFAELSNLGNF